MTPKESTRGLRTGPRIMLLAAIVTAMILAAAAPVLPADVPIATIPVGDAPVAVAVNPVTQRVYVANYYGGTVSLIDGVTDSTVATITMPRTTSIAVPVAVAVDPLVSRAVVGNWYSDIISVIDEASASAVATIATEYSHGAGPRAVAMNPAASKAYVVDYGNNAVCVVDMTTLTRVKDIPVGSQPRALGIYVGAGRTRLFCANRGSNTVSVIDGDTDTVVATLAVGSAPKCVAVDPDTGWAYVTNETGNSVSVIDDTDQVSATIAVGVAPKGIAVDPAGDRVFVANNGSANVSVIDAGTSSVVATVTAGTSPFAVAVEQGARKVFVTNYGSDTVTVIDQALGTTTVPTGDAPYALAVNEGVSPTKVYVTNWLGDSVTVIDEPAGLGVAVAASTAWAADGSPVVTTVDPIPGDTTSSASPVFTGTATCVRSPAVSPVLAVYYRLDGSSGPWSRAEIVDGAGTTQVRWAAALPGPVAEGPHTLQVAAVDAAMAAQSSSDFGASGASGAFGAPTGYSFTISSEPPDLAGPVLSDVSVEPVPVRVGTSASLHARIDDALSGASAPVTGWWSLNGGAWAGMSPVDGAFDGVAEDAMATVGPFTSARLATIAVRGVDGLGNESEAASLLLPVYDPLGGSVSGRGYFQSPAGACPAEPTFSATAAFSMSAKYRKSATVPTGGISLTMPAPGPTFSATAIEWLVVTGGRSWCAGAGTLNGATGYRFQCYAADGALTGGVDRVRYRITKALDGSTVYDNGLGAPLDEDAGSPLTKGQVTIR